MTPEHKVVATIDLLIESLDEGIFQHYYKKNTYDYLVTFKFKLVLTILKSKTNVPSVHDLNLLRSCISIRDKVVKYKSMDSDEAAIKIYDEIIEIYKNRKN